MDPISPRIREVMAGLEARDAADRTDGTPRSRRLRAVMPEVGELLVVLALARSAREIVEVGTSSGYSSLWLAAAAAETGGRVVTYETDPAKVDLARSTFAAAGVEERVELRAEDGAAGLATFRATADLVFLDAEKEDYERMLDPAVRALRAGGLLVADNILSHADDLRRFRDLALGDPRLCGRVLPVGRGELVAVRR